MRLIDDVIYRKDVLDALDITPLEVHDYELAVGVIKDIPSAQKKGHWIKRFYIGTNSSAVVCSNCRTVWSYDAETGVSDYFFCPNCGADMRGDEK